EKTRLEGLGYKVVSYATNTGTPKLKEITGTEANDTGLSKSAATTRVTEYTNKGYTDAKATPDYPELEGAGWIASSKTEAEILESAKMDEITGLYYIENDETGARTYYRISAYGLGLEGVGLRKDKDTIGATVDLSKFGAIGSTIHIDTHNTKTQYFACDDVAVHHDGHTSDTGANQIVKGCIVESNKAVMKPGNYPRQSPIPDQVVNNAEVIKDATQTYAWTDVKTAVDKKLNAITNVVYVTLKQGGSIDSISGLEDKVTLSGNKIVISDDVTDMVKLVFDTSACPLGRNVNLSEIKVSRKNEFADKTVWDFGETRKEFSVTISNGTVVAKKGTIHISGTGQAIASTLYVNSGYKAPSNTTIINENTITPTYTVTASAVKGIVATAQEVKGIVATAQEVKGIVATAQEVKGIVATAEEVKGIVATAEEVKGIVATADAVQGVKLTAKPVLGWTIVADAVDNTRWILDASYPTSETTYYYGQALQETPDTPDTPTTPATPVTPAAPFTFTFTAPVFAAAPAAPADVAAPAVFTAPAPAAAPAAAPVAGVLGANRPAGGAAAAVLGEQRSTGSVLGARRDADTADASGMAGWLSAFAASTSLLGTWTLCRKKREED
ncbi:hypothetical protein SAMN02910292_02424, partial [Lachnospiraceae bacterium XBB2008]